MSHMHEMREMQSCKKKGRMLTAPALRSGIGVYGGGYFSSSIMRSLTNFLSLSRDVAWMR